MGSVLTPQFVGIEKTYPLPNASTFCGRCEEVCPVRIPLPKLMRYWRDVQFKSCCRRPRGGAWPPGPSSPPGPRLYRLATGIGMRTLKLLAGRRGRFHRLPLAGGWTGTRDLPAPAGRTFMASWKPRPGSRA